MLEYLKSRQILKAQSFGNSVKGVPMTVPIRNFAFGLIRDWLLKPVTVSREEEGQIITSTVPNLFFIKDRALLLELSKYNPDGNFDRIMYLCQSVHLIISNLKHQHLLMMNIHKT